MLAVDCTFKASPRAKDFVGDRWPGAEIFPVYFWGLDLLASAIRFGPRGGFGIDSHTLRIVLCTHKKTLLMV
jgi:hypothetical protein